MKKYSVCAETELDFDSWDYDDLEEAKACCLDVMSTWVYDFWLDHEIDDGIDTYLDAKDDWDDIHEFNRVYVAEVIGKNEYKTVWEPTEEDKKKTGWLSFNGSLKVVFEK